MKFEGTDHAERIRKSSSSRQAQRLATPHYQTFDENHEIVRRLVCGNDEMQYVIRDDWKSVERSYLENALRVKFSDQRLLKRLLNTRDARIVDRNTPSLGPLLMMIRDEVLKPSKENIAAHQMKDDTRDLPKGQLTSEEKNLIDEFIRLSLTIRDLEGQNYWYAEMTEDAVLIVGKGKLFADSVKWLDRKSWSIIYTDYPRFEKLVRDVHSIVSQRDSFQKKQIRASAVIASVIRWWRLDASDAQKNELKKAFSDIDGKEIMLPTIKRWYRQTIPPKMKKRTKESTKRGKRTKRVDFAKENVVVEYLSPKKMKSDAKPKQVKVITELKIKRSGDEMFVLEGPTELLDKHHKKLLELGGKHQVVKGVVKTTSMRFANSALDAVEAIVFDDFPEQKKYSELIKKWIQTKANLFIDTAEQFEKLNGGSKITRDSMNNAIKIYSCDLPQAKDDAEVFVNIDDERLTTKAHQVLMNTLYYLSSVLTNDGQLNYTEVKERLEAIEDNLKNYQVPTIEGLSDHQVALLRSAFFILEKSEIKTTPETLAWSFTTVFPAKERVKLEERCLETLNVVRTKGIDEATSGLKCDVEAISKVLENIDIDNDEIRAVVCTALQHVDVVKSKTLEKRLRIFGYSEPTSKPKKSPKKSKKSPKKSPKPTPKKSPKKSKKLSPKKSRIHSVKGNLAKAKEQWICVFTNADTDRTSDTARAIYESFPYARPTRGSVGTVYLPKCTSTQTCVATIFNTIGSEKDEVRRGWSIAGLKALGESGVKSIAFSADQVKEIDLEEFSSRYKIDIFLYSKVKAIKPHVDSEGGEDDGGDEVFYNSIFSRFVSHEDLVTVTESIEKMTDKQRAKWLATFMKGKDADKKRMIKALL